MADRLGLSPFSSFYSTQVDDAVTSICMGEEHAVTLSGGLKV